MWYKCGTCIGQELDNAIVGYMLGKFGTNVGHQGETCGISVLSNEPYIHASIYNNYQIDMLTYNERMMQD